MGRKNVTDNGVPDPDMEKAKKMIWSGRICIVAGVLCLLAGAGFLTKNYLDSRNTQEQMEVLRSQAQESIPDDPSVQEQSLDNETTQESLSETQSDKTQAARETQTGEEDMVSNPYAEAYEANSDMVGWLKIEGTKIDYPIMQTMEDENYYLKRGFDKKSNENGCLILDTDSVITEPLSTNLIVHGHNMKSGEMFGDLEEYEDPAYYEEHKYVQLYTRECLRNYEVIAVFRSQVYRKTDDVFKFYKFFQADTQEEFDDWYQNIKELSEFDTGVTAQFSDRFLTLSTCVYHVENGRLVVVAKEIEPGEYYE